MKRATSPLHWLGLAPCLALWGCAELASEPSSRVDPNDASIEVEAWPVIADTWARWLPSEAGATSPEVAEAPHRVAIASSSRLDFDLVLGAQASVSQVDAVRFRERTYLALRASLPDGTTRIDLVSSDDERTFRRESSLVGRRVHSGRLLVLADRLFAYASEVADDGNELHPRGVYGASLEPDGLWSDWRSLDLGAQLVFRTKVERGIPLMTSYALSEKQYAFEDGALEVRLLTTENGFDWRPLRSGQHAVYRGGGSQAAFSSDDDGNLYSVVRREAGDEAGFGSALCASVGADWARWECVNDPKKYDSPTLFNHEGELYLVARRHAAADGTNDRGDGFSLLRRTRNEARELAAKKRCALWHFDRAHQRVEFLLDLPSRGDTCAAAVMPGAESGEFVIYDHSSPLDGPDVSLREGRLGPTHAYRHVVRFEPTAVEGAKAGSSRSTAQ